MACSIDEEDGRGSLKVSEELWYRGETSGCALQLATLENWFLQSRHLCLSIENVRCPRGVTVDAPWPARFYDNLPRIEGLGLVER